VLQIDLPGRANAPRFAHDARFMEPARRGARIPLRQQRTSVEGRVMGKVFLIAPDPRPGADDAQGGARARAPMSCARRPGQPRLPALPVGTSKCRGRKRGGCKATPQEFIERLLVQYARQGMIVARLKGGDPFVFAAAARNSRLWRAAGIEVEVIPGISAGIAAPPTRNSGTTVDVSRGVILVTGHSKDGAEPTGTLRVHRVDAR